MLKTVQKQIKQNQKMYKIKLQWFGKLGLQAKFESFVLNLAAYLLN